MTRTKLDTILEQLQALQAELDREVEQALREKRDRFRYSLEQGKIRFEESIRKLQLRQRTGLWRYLREARLRHVLTAPVIYSLIVPFALLDAAVTFYQQVCFRAYAIPRVSRSDFVVIDRQYLAYLNIIEKFNCMFCGYANGVIAYTREVAARTEQFWCPIKHARRIRDPHARMSAYADYGDPQAYRERLKTLRAALAEETRD
ncbi:MAG TPA: hypothetical protein ENK49_13520 [Gammaproteobacteria bacterium]|nr:hypothetical protein [Gammaproteobacteria bacterium]